jgi:NACHT domain
MESLEFPEVADLLNCSRSISIEKRPAKAMPGNWDLYTGAYTIHGRRFPFEVLYLHSRASQDAILKARKDAFREGETQVVYASSLTRRMRAHEELLRPGAERFVTLPEYLASFIKEELKTYTAQLVDRQPAHYVEPKIATPSGIARKFPNPLENFLEDPASEDLDDGHVAVLLAEPGQGKTFMCDYLVSRLARKATGQSSNLRFAPIYINAEQWKSMDEGEIASLHKTMTHCFRYFESPIGWLDGNEEVFLRTTLRAGLFRVVFDGFDEYVLRSHGGVTALEALSSLCTLARSTGTRIVITARTTFWSSEIEGRIAELTGDTGNLFVYHIEPFEYSQATQYFNKRLGESTGAATKASALYKQLQYGGNQFVGRGFVLSLIADLYERDSEFEAKQIMGGPVTWLLHALCEREQLRQSLPLSPEQQLSILMQCAVEEARGRYETDAGVALLIQSEDVNLDEDAAKLCRTKLTTHPLLGRDPSVDQWRITQGQAKVSLVARFLSGRLAIRERDQLIERFSNEAAWDPGFYDDLAAMLVEQNTEHADDQRVKAISTLLERLLLCDSEGAAALPRLAVLTAIRFVDAHSELNNNRQERTAFLESLLPGSKFVNLQFTGSISKFDFRGRHFIRGRFDNIRWANCRFDDTTTFDRCNFRGGNVDHCENFGRSQFKQCDGDDAGMAVIHAEQIAAGARTYSDADLKSDIRHIVQKFIPKGGFILKSVRQDHLRTGAIRRSRFAEMVIAEISRHLLEEHHIAGSKESGFHVKSEATECVKFFATNNVFTGPLDEAYRKLKIKAGVASGKR